MDEEQRNKTHKNKTAGSKALKKDLNRKKKAGIDLQPNRGSNVKAFQGPSSGSHKAQKLFRSIEKREVALALPSEDKTFRHIVGEPPILVAVVGPPGSGKTTLIRTLVKFYSNRNLHHVRGPITVIAGNSRRVTFIECPNTLTAMCDIAKVADLVLLMVDGNYGFEMETFEFLTIAQVHGFPKMFGVVSHLDQLKTGKSLKKRKKFLRHRFWHEVAAGAKLLCLSPMVRGMYRASDVLKLHRLLICVEPKIQQWRNTHSCVLIDRHEDITPPDQVAQDEKTNRTVAFYGYARGRPMKPGQNIHIPGFGDFPVSYISHQDDPCPLELKQTSNSQGHKMRHLSMKQKKLYAPYCDVGGLTYDDDAVYVQEDKEKALIERSGEGFELLRDLQRAKPMDASKAKLAILRRPVNFRDEDTMELEMDPVQMPSDDEDDTDSSASDEPKKATRMPSLKDYGLPNQNYDDDDDDDGGNDFDEDEESGEAGNEMLNGGSSYALLPRLANDDDSVRISEVAHEWGTNAELIRLVKNLCVTGDWNAGKDEDDERDDLDNQEERSKGYSSSDEEFDALTRGDMIKSTKSGKKTKPSNRNADSSDTGEDEEEEGEEEEMDLSEGPNSSHGNRHTAWDDAFMPTTRSGNHSTKNTSITDDYDILADDEDEDSDVQGADKADGMIGESDPELAGLVSTFLNGSSKKGGNQIKSEEGITYYDDEISADNKEQKKADSLDELDEAIVKGDELTEEQELKIKEKVTKKKMFDADDADGLDDNGKNNTFSYYYKLNQEAEDRKKQLDAALGELGDDILKKIKLVGYFSGLYVRFVVENVPVEFVNLFDPCHPLIAGGLNAGEDQFQIVQARLKRHRWYPKILKAQDPLLLSMGWRRFQTQPIFASEDPSGRLRYLKYTPLHMHCMASFYAPLAPPNTGFLAIPVRDSRVANFRIPCTGYTIGNDNQTSIVKKLKLTGTPMKIQKTTAFIKGMFTSDVEAAKFLGAKLKSVSGIRGIIKSVLKGKNGVVRATFEDKVFPSDIVFIRAWKPVDPPQFCSIQRNLLDKDWAGMRTMRELRWDYNVPIPMNADSEYKEIKRRNRSDDSDPSSASQKILISRNMRMQLPYDMKEEFIPLEKTSAMQQTIKAATTVAPEPREMKRRALMDVFEDKRDTLVKRKEEAKRRALKRQQERSAADEQEYLNGLKKAKKETARKEEFRSQHKSRKSSSVRH